MVGVGGLGTELGRCVGVVGAVGNKAGTRSRWWNETSGG